MINFNSFQDEPESLKNAMHLAIRDVIDSGWYILGPQVEKFENQWASKCGLPYAIGVGNGMDAIELILRGLDIGPGDEVITTAMTAFPTVLAIIRSGATPVLADIDPETALLSIDSVKRCLSSRTRAIVLVHLYGQLSQMDEWVNFSSEKNIYLIEDCAQSHLASYGGVCAGGFGVAGAYSFYPTKNLGALGDAGMVVTSDQALAERIQKLRNYGQSERYHHPEIGMNSRLDEIQAAILIERLKFLDQFTDARINIANQYIKRISNSAIENQKPAKLNSHVYHLYILRSQNRSDLQAHLKQQGVQSLIHYPIPLHRQESVKNIAKDPLGLLAAEAHANSCLSLPCHPQLSALEVDTVIEAVNAFEI